MWAMGAIMAELFTFQPLFRGSSDARVMRKIYSVLGTPEGIWFDGVEELARYMNYRFPGVMFSELLPNASLEVVNLIGSLLSWDPNTRPTAIEALQHPFFHGCYRVPPSVRFEVSLVFELAMLRKMTKKKSSIKSCASVGVRSDTHHDVISLLPEYPFEFMKPIEQV
ncbi:putative protein-serine/threonine kinase CMGC-RCK family [Helianthus anomalus]